jgi:hypothetical protein
VFDLTSDRAFRSIFSEPKILALKSLAQLQMFIGCCGLKVLVEMIDENYEEQKDLMWMAVDGICRVFEMQESTGLSY